MIDAVQGQVEMAVAAPGEAVVHRTLSSTLNQTQMRALAAHVAAGGCVLEATRRSGSRPSTVKRDLADLRLRMSLTTEPLIYAGRAAEWILVPSLVPTQLRQPRCSLTRTPSFGIDRLDVTTYIT